jgi:hypothetical protein
LITYDLIGAVEAEIEAIAGFTVLDLGMPGMHGFEAANLYDDMHAIEILARKGGVLAIKTD